MNTLLPQPLRDVCSMLVKAGPAWVVVLASLALSLVGVKAIDVGESLAAGEGARGTLGLALGPIASRQLAYLGVGIVAAALVSIPHYRRLGPLTWAFFAVVLCMLVFLLIPMVPTSIVRPRGGARSWIDLGPINFQPSELMKVAYILTLGWYLRYKTNHRTIRGLLPPAILTGIPLALIILQPDLGTALLFIPTLFFVLIAAGAKIKHLVLVVALACLAAPAAYPILKPHQKQRIHGLFMQLRGDTSEDLDINMQSVTAQRLIGAGGAVGVPDAHARALQRFNALPERHNDMVFSPIVTRAGLLGGLVTLGLFFLWMLGALWTAATCNEPFARLICVGAAGFLFAQVMVNVGMNLGLAPIIGITLPYVSHGGSSMLIQWMVVGLIFGVGMRRESYEIIRGYNDPDDR